MITELYTFSPGSFVVADEWNANFSVLNKTSQEHLHAIQDAKNVIAFKDGDLTNVFNAANSFINSRAFSGNSLKITIPNNEYWNSTDLSTSQQLILEVEKINGEARVLFKTTGVRSQTPLVINYAGGSANVNYIDNIDVWQNPGVKIIFLYETNNKLNVRMVKAE